MLSGNVIGQAIPFVIAPILTRLYTPEDFAVYANYIAIATLIGIVSSGRLEIAIPIAKDKHSARNIVFAGLVITIVLVVLSCAIPVFSTEIANFYDNPGLAKYLISIPIAILSISFLGLTYNWVLRLKKYSLLSIGKISQSLINNGLAAILGYIGWGPEGLIYGWLLSQFIGIIVMLLFVDRKFHVKSFNVLTIKSTLKEYKDFPLINSLHAFTDIFALQVVMFWIISNYFGLIELGLFVMMDKYVKAPISLITSSVSSIFYTETGEALSIGKSPIPILKKTLKTSFAFSIPFILILLVFAPQLFAWYFGEEWGEAGKYAQRIVPMLGVTFLLSPISSIPILMNQQKKAFLFAFIGYFLTLGSLFLASIYGWNFLDALTVYAITFVLFQISYLYWFYLLIKNRNVNPR
tara:strand:- start:18138 stop:19361 length:1224 start_codon:yes stop_codon:yes gene_type:complete